jgi:hypothetical protein
VEREGGREPKHVVAVGASERNKIKQQREIKQKHTKMAVL